MRTLKLQLAVLLAVGTFSRAALAIDNGACCVQTTSRLEALLNPARGSDENFFSFSAGAPNVLLIVDTSGSMEDWPAPWPTSKGCNSNNSAANPNLHPALAGYDPSKNYPALYTGFTSQTIPTEHPEWFNRSKFYTVPSSHFGNNFSSSGAPVNTTVTTSATNACAGLAASADRTQCASCLATDGYYIQSSSWRVASGNFLNYYGPRDFGAVSALSHLVFSIREVRMSVMMLTKYQSGSAKCFANAGSGSNCACMLEDFGPSCDKAFPLDQSAVQNNRNSILNKLAAQGTWGGCNTPLADLMYAGAHLFKSTSPDGFTAAGVSAGYPTDTDYNESGGANGKTVCSGCGFNTIILITDGEPQGENLSIPSAMGTPAIGAPQCTGAYCGSKVDEIARWLWNTDVRADFSSTQKVATYTVGIAVGADPTKLLQSTAQAGGGKYYPANRSSEIEEVVGTIFQDVLSRNTSFASAAVATVQTASTSLPAVLPRMLPKTNKPWEGRVWRFNQYNEFVENNDLNADGDKEDVFIVEDVTTPTMANVVTETADGTFVKNATSVPATPVWEANAKLVSDLASGVGNRKVYTVLDTNGDGAFTDADAVTQVKFGTQAEDLRFAEYMGLRSSPRCPSGAGLGTMMVKLGMTLAQAQTVTGLAAPATQTDYDQLCARLVIRWIQGADLFDEDGDGNLGEVRPVVLGDVFHSSPVLVDAPVEPFLCDLGLSNQCVRTLYSQTLQTAPTPMSNESVSAVCGGPTTLPAYDAWVLEQRKRQKLVLVGSNDGMVHAFDTGGTWSSDTCAGTKWATNFNTSTGKEMWAFLPPDQLPRIADSLLGHEYMVDGDIMVRDVWADSSTNPGQKDKSEYHTLAVVSEGRGGKHYFALDLTYDAAGLATVPNFRWMYPQPCSPEAANFGRTFNSISPKPPPIGPILLDNDNVSVAGAIPRYGQSTHERWVVALSGGWSPGLEKGRGIYVVDAWNGKVNSRSDNLLWKFEFDEGTSPNKELTYGVSSPVALVDFGANADPKQDGFFDTGVFGDTQGQVWIARMHNPGHIDSTTKLIDNWAAARAFEMDRDGVPGGAADTTLPDGGTETADPSAKSIANKSPFYYLPSVAIEPGVNKMRVFIGTGNRYAVLENGAGMCRFDNPVACSKSKCDDMKVVTQREDGVVKIDKMETHWKSRRFEHGKLDRSVKKDGTSLLTAADMCGTAGSTRVTAENETYHAGTCDLTSGTDPNLGNINDISFTCGLNAAGTSFSCTQQSVDRAGALDDLLDSTRVDTTNLGLNRFFGFWAYGGTRTFVERPDGGTTPAQFDTFRLSDRSTSNPGTGDLIDVTQTGCTTSGCDGGARSADYGWFIDYPSLDSKTATGAAVIASCVLWSDISPTGGDGGACASAATPLSRVYQADFITGQPNCAYGFLDAGTGVFSRSQGRTVVAPPPEPASVVQVSKTGEVRYSAMIVEPGKDQATSVNVSGGQDVLQLVYQLPVSRSLHNCRHADGGCVTAP